MKIFPYTLIRLGGESYEQWAQFKFEKTLTAMDQTLQYKQSINTLKEQLSESLIGFIQTLDDPKEQNLLQNLRRDIYNNRKLKQGKVNAALEKLPDDTANQLRELVDTKAKLKTLTQDGTTIYDEELAESREQFKSLIQSELLQKGLILSSRSLLDRVDSYIQRDVNSFRKKEVQIEQGIIKYLTRMFAKTSPFSTFTNLSVGELGQTNGQAITIKHKKEGQENIVGHIRLNNYLLKYLLDLFKSYREAYSWFYLRPNPTVENKQDHFLYLTNNNNVEAFQRIPFNPVVELILETVKSETEGVRFNSLVTMLMEQIDAEESELEGYVKQLIDFGLLEYNIGVSGIDPDWDLKLVDTLAPLASQGVPNIEALISTLGKLRQLGNQYAQEGVEGRKKILTEAFDDFRDICMKIHEAAGLPEEERKTQEERIAERKKKEEEEKQKQEAKETPEQGTEEAKEEEKQEEEVFKHQASTFFNFKPEQIFYEDTTREVEAYLDEAALGEFTSKLDQALQSLKLFKGMEEEKIKMKHYFLNKYGEDGSTDLLTFYEDYFREFKKPEKEREEKKKKEAAEKAKKIREAKEKSEELPEEATKEATESDAPDIPQLKERGEIMKTWNEAYAKEITTLVQKDKGEVSLSYDTINNTNTDTKRPAQAPSANSYGCFAQFYHDENTGKLKAVLNSSFAGYGKMMSRFLHIFDKKVTETLREWNLSLNKEDKVLIEDCDASYFNANLHPPLMPYEIWMPGGHNTLPAEKQLPITDFEVSFKADKPYLTLTHKPSGKEAHVFDLGFQGQMGRSQLFQLLDKFSMAEFLFAHPLVNAVNSIAHKPEDKKEEENEKPADKKPQITTSPRIIYEDQIIIQRKTWHVPKTLIPVKETVDSDWDYFMKVNEWRKALGIPDEVFIVINTNRWGGNVDPELTKKLTRDDYKPQYIDFTNPLLVNLFEKTTNKVPVNMKIQEMLPNSKQMLSIDGERFVSEFVVQWYREK